MNKIIKPGFFRFEKQGNKYLLTNEIGNFAFLEKEDFENFVNNKLLLDSEVGKELAACNFLKDSYSIKKIVDKYKQRNEFLLHKGPSLHIIILTLRCNHKCVYCRAASDSINAKDKDLTKEKAKETIDFIFSVPNKDIAIEFQGGEPLLNWSVLKFIIQYANKKNKRIKKNLEFRIVSNFSLLTEEKMKFLFDNKVNLCMSLDGPEQVHNRNRIMLGGQSYRKASFWLKKVIKDYERRMKNEIVSSAYYPGAVLTISRNSLKYPKQIVDEYVKWGFKNISIRPVSALSLTKKKWKIVGYSAKEFINFYKKSINYILDLNQKGIFLRESIAGVMLQKILTDYSTNYLDMRSPCGGVIGQLLYNYDGKIYTCDEGRMLGNDMFMVGMIGQNNYNQVIKSDTTGTMCLASCLDCLSCDYCVYKPYCGVCPVESYALANNIFALPQSTERCKIQKGIFDYLFHLLRDSKKAMILEQWIDKDKWHK